VRERERERERERIITVFWEVKLLEVESGNWEVVKTNEV
jgi:hypothetical protein